jgi:hypothetical protein
MSKTAVLPRCGALPFALVAYLFLCNLASAASPFAGFTGNWKGGGTIRTDSGREAIRCKARYATTSGDSTLNINVNCASDSYRVNIVSTVIAQGDNFSGSWQETTRQISGDVSGRIPEANTFQASLQTLGGGLQLGARTNGKQQAITITSQGSDIQGATIKLKKR